MPKPKLLCVITEDWYFVAHRLRIAMAARDAGYDVAVATNVHEHREPILDAGIKLHAIPFRRVSINPLVAANEIRLLRQLYKLEGPDILHLMALRPIVFGSLAARGLSINGTVNGIAGLGRVFTTQSLQNRALRGPVGLLLRQAINAPRTTTTVENADDRDDLVNAGIARPDKVRVIHGAGVDMAKFDLPPPPPGLPLVVLPARLLKLKGVVEFVEAARILKGEGIAARFALVGSPDPGNASSVTDADVETWRREGAVEIWGFRSDMTRVLEEATIVCLPTYREGLPMSLIEAAAARRAIVTTDVPGARHVAHGGQAGWLVPPRDGVALADALRDAIRNPEKRRVHTEAAYADAVAYYDQRRIADETIAIYDALLKA